MSNNRLLRHCISNLINTKNLTDDHVIEGICQFLNVKYPLEEPKRVQDDFTFEEAFNKVYQLQKQYSPGLDKAWVKCQLRSWEALGIVKFRENEIEYSHTVYRNYNKVVVISETVIKQVAQKLRQKCTEIFGSAWNNENAEEFAKTAIEEYERLTNK